VTQKWTQIYEGLHQGWKAEAPKAEVVFVHGLDAHWLSTWHPTGSDDGWMQWLGRDLPGANVYALDYEVAKTGWLGDAWPLADRAKHLLDVVHYGIPGHLPLIFICHSLGGLHVKKLVESADSSTALPQWASVVNRVHGVVFFATPHDGSKLANMALRLPQLLVRPTVAIEDLRADSSQLIELDERFRSIVTKRRTPILSFRETRKTARGGIFGKVFKATVVDPNSANPKIPDMPCLPAEGDHSTMCKFVDDRQRAYRRTLDFVGKIINVTPAPPSSPALPSPKPKASWWKRTLFKLLGEPPQGVISSGIGGVPSLLSGVLDLRGTASVAADDDSGDGLTARERSLISAAVLGQAKATNFYALGLRPNPRFVGREQALTDLLAAMFPPNSPDAVQPTALSQGFAGEGGIGKSQLAQRFAEQTCKALGGGAEGWDRFDCAWWLDCAAATHGQALRVLAEHLGHAVNPQETPADLRRAVQRLLGDGRRHLLVLDNLEPQPGADPASAEAWSLVGELALPPNGRVLLTTRDKNPPVEVGAVVRLEALSPDEALTLLRSARADLANEQHAAVLTHIAEHLGRLALAVDMARAWLTLHPGEGPQTLLDQLKPSDQAVVAFFEDHELTDRAAGYRRSVASALTLHLPTIAGQPAEALLNAAAYCAPSAIPGDLLRVAAGLSPQDARDGLAQLVSKSLIHHEPGPFGGRVHVHRLTQTVVRARVSDANAESVGGTLMSLIEVLIEWYCWPDTVAEERVDHVKNAARMAAVAHAEAAIVHYEAIQRESVDGENLTKSRSNSPINPETLREIGANVTLLRGEMAKWLPDVGMHSAAERHLSAAIKWGEAQSPRDERNLAIDYASRARVRHDRGMLREAEEDLAKAIAWGETQSPRDERSLAIDYAARADSRHDRGLLKEAVEDINKAITWGEAQDPRDERVLVIWYSTRASIRRFCGQLLEAEEDLDKTIAWGEAQSPRDERSLAIDYAARSQVRHDRGRLKEAEQDLEKALAWGERQFPRDERSLAIDYANRARIRVDQGQYALALSDVQRSLSWAGAQQPVDEWGIALWRGNRATIFAEMNRLDEARADIAHCIAWHTANQPDNRSRMARFRRDQARIFAQSGMWTEAAASIAAALPLHEAVFGPDHEWTKKARAWQSAIAERRVPPRWLDTPAGV